MSSSRFLRAAAAIAVAGSMLALPAAASAAPSTSAATVAAGAKKKAVRPAPAYLNTCRPAKAKLPASVLGNPKLKPGRTSNAAKGLYVYHDGKGWKVRLTHNLKTAAGKGAKVEVRGRITSSRPISHLKLVRLEDKQRGEWVAIQARKRQFVDFRFTNYGYIDGIDFTAGCAGRLTFTVSEITKVNGKVTRTRLPVFVGKSRTQLTTATTPALLAKPANASRFVVLRTPVKK